MQSQPADQQHCEQCGAPFSRRLSGIGCLHCLLRGGMEDDGAETTLSPADFGTRFFQHYEVLTRDDGSPWELGRGAMGVTYKAVDVNLQVPVALKVINGRISSQPGARERFLREAQAAARLRHPNVASVFHFGTVNALPSTIEAQEQVEIGDCFYAMEFVEGETLEACLRRSGPLTPVVALQIGLQVAHALAAAEKRGLVHRDLKPANIMLLDEDEFAGGSGGNGRSNETSVKVIDFGLAKVAGEADEPAGSSRFLGTPAFASPEQLAQCAIDVRSDIYSLGVLLWYSLTGKLPFPARPPSGGVDSTSRQSLPVEQLVDQDVPPAVVELLERMLAEDPADRPSSAVVLAHAFEDCLTTLSGEPAARISWFDGTRRRVAISAIGLAAALVGLAFFFFWPASSTSDKSIAVLPFKNLSSDPQNAFFADGIEDDLLSSLVKIRDLKVISRLSTARYVPGVPRDLPKIGRELGVRHVLQGSLRREGNHVLLQVSLVDTRDGHTIWADRYDRTLADAISLQGELASAIADALDATLSPREKVDIRSKPTLNANAYLLYLRARKYEHGTVAAVANFEAAEAFYQQALAFDPGFALAHARLASRLALLYHIGGPNEDLKQRARFEAQEALRLQPGLGEGHLAKGLYFYYMEHDFQHALPEFEAARRLLPNDPEPESFIAYIHRRQGEWRSARAELERVASRDPRNMSYEEELFATACLLRDWSSAATHVKKAQRLAPGLIQLEIEEAYLDFWRSGDLRPVRTAFSSYVSPGGADGVVAWGRWDAAMLARDFARAQAAIDGFPYDTLTAVFGGPIPKSYLAGCTKLAQGQTAAAQELFEISRPSMEAEILVHPDDPVRHARLGLLYAYMGRKDAAIHEGERAVELQPVSKDAYDGPERLCNLALIHARVGDNEEAIAMVKSLLQQPGGTSFYEASLSLSDLRLRWQWDPLRTDPRFQQILVGPEPITIY